MWFLPGCPSSLLGGALGPWLRAAGRAALLLSEKRIMTPEMLPCSRLWSFLLGCGALGVSSAWGWAVLSAALLESLPRYSVTPCYFKAKPVTLLHVDSEGGVALFHTNPRVVVYLGIEESRGAHVKKYSKLCVQLVRGELGWEDWCLSQFL